MTLFSEELYTVEAHNDDVVIIRLSGKEHTVFKAHFPQKALLPGFLQIDIFAEIMGVAVTEISSAKFLKVISPDEVVIYRYKKDKQKLRLEIYNEKEELVSDMRLCIE